MYSIFWQLLQNENVKERQIKVALWLTDYSFKKKKSLSDYETELK